MSTAAGTRYRLLARLSHCTQHFSAFHFTRDAMTGPQKTTGLLVGPTPYTFGACAEPMGMLSFQFGAEGRESGSRQQPHNRDLRLSERSSGRQIFSNDSLSLSYRYHCYANEKRVEVWHWNAPKGQPRATVGLAKNTQKKMFCLLLEDGFNFTDNKLPFSSLRTFNGL